MVRKMLGVLFMLLLVGCSTDRTTQVHEAAKLLKDKGGVCYTVDSPDNVKGYYCLQYMHD